MKEAKALLKNIEIENYLQFIEVKNKMTNDKAVV